MTQLQFVGGGDDLLKSIIQEFHGWDGVLLVSNYVRMKFDFFSLISSTCIKEVIVVILLKGSIYFVSFNKVKHVQTTTCLACEILFGNCLAVMGIYSLL